MLVLILIGTVFMLWLWSRKNRSNDEPPVSSGSKILIGHALKYAGNSDKLWNTVQNFCYEAIERGGVLKTTIGPRTCYIVTDPEDFITASNACIHKDAIYEFARPWIGDGLITARPSIWKVHRKLLSPAFNQSVLDNFTGVFNSQARRLVQNFKEVVGKGLFDPWEYTKRTSLETICLTAFGVDIKEKSEDNIKFVLALDRLFNIFITRFQKFWLHNSLLFSLTSLKRQQDECIKILQSTTDKILEKKKENLKKKLTNAESVEKEKVTGSNIKPFMELLLELSRETDVITDVVIKQQLDTLIAAGSDSSATLVMFCMLLVGSYPRVQEKIFEELKTIFGDEDRDITKQDLSQLVYLEAVIKETFRIYPVVPVVARYLDEDVKLRNCTLLKGNTVFLFIYGVNRHANWGPDVEEFKPQRWLDPTLENFPNTIVGFGLGRRNCLGKNFAMTAIKISLAHIFRNYKIHSDHTKVRFRLDVLLKPVSGHEISIENRF